MVRVTRFERAISTSQMWRGTNSATPGYSVFCHYTTLGAKIKVIPVCGQSCGQSRFSVCFHSLPKSRKRRCFKDFRAFASHVMDGVHRTPKAGALVSCGSRKNLRAYADPRFFRPLPLTRLPLSATGGGRLVPQLRYTRLCENAPP